MTTARASAGGARPVVVYDGACRFCRAQADRIRRRDDADAFEYVPRQADGLTERFPRLAEGDFDTGMRLVHPDGAISVGADAVYEIARRVRGWRRLAWLYRVPVLHGLFRLGYVAVARNRTRLGRTCAVGADGDGVCARTPDAT